MLHVRRCVCSRVLKFLTGLSVHEVLLLPKREKLWLKGEGGVGCLHHTSALELFTVEKNAVHEKFKCCTRTE